MQQKIQAFVIERAAYYLDLSGGAVDVNRRLGDYGVDSIYLMSIISDLEAELDFELSLEELAEVDTISELAARVEGMAIA